MPEPWVDLAGLASDTPRGAELAAESTRMMIGDLSDQRECSTPTA
jgi:hypothetical protein